MGERMQRKMWGAVAALLALGFAAGAGATEADTARYRGWVAQMKEAPRGPFDGIRWFCKDGRVLQPQDLSCAKHGTGWQHGQWSAQTRELRAQGWRVATLLAGIDAPKTVAAPDFADVYGQLLIERFLVASDNG